jgi:hypothetical protein
VEPQIIGIITAMVFSAFFSGVEMAFVSSNKLYFELKAKQDLLSAKIISNFNQKPSQFIGTMLIGNTLSLVAYGIFMEEYLHHAILTNIPYITNVILARLLASIVATIVILTTSEFTPKSIFLINPDAILEFLAIPILIINSLMFPLVWLTVGLSKWFITRVLRLSYSEEKPAFGLTDLNHYLQNLTSNIALTIAGPTEDKNYWEECLTLIKTFSPNIQVNYVGEITPTQVMPLIKEHHLYCLPTQGENFGHSIFESFMIGCPVLISNKTPWLNLNEKTSYLVFKFFKFLEHQITFDCFFTLVI